MKSRKANMLKVLNHDRPDYVPFQLESIIPVSHRDALFYARNGDPELSQWTDAWGVDFMIPENMNDDSGFPTSHPLKNLDELDDFSWPDPDDPALFKSISQELEKIDRSQYFLMGLNPAVLFVRSWLICGMDTLLSGTIIQQKEVEYLLDKVTEYQMRIAERYVELGIDIAHMGDDIGTTQSMLMSPEFWRELIKPRLKKIIDIYKAGGCFIYFHSCGRVMELLDDFIELGIDILNPLQASANNLPLIREKTRGKISLHGGINCDLIMRGNIAEIEQETKHILDILAEDGEYIADADQKLPFPEEHLKAVESTVRKFGAYA